MKEKAFFIILEGLLLKEIVHFFLEGQSSTLIICSDIPPFTLIISFMIINN